jgi:hypothetical protein
MVYSVSLELLFFFVVVVVFVVTNAHSSSTLVDDTPLIDGKISCRQWCIQMMTSS